jgi:hypothetical protein
MPDLPWEFLATRLGRFLQLGYIYAVVAGAFIISYFAAPSLGSTPQQRRAVVWNKLYQLTHPASADIFSTILIILGGLLACYLVGMIVRVATYRISSFVYLTAVNLFYQTEVGRRWGNWKSEKGPSSLIKYEYPRGRREVNLAIKGRQYRIPDWLAPLAGYLEQRVSYRLNRWSGKGLWSELTYIYGEEALTKVLVRHPIKISVLEKGDVNTYWDYCSSWLRRYAPGEAITPRATAYLTASSLLIPAWLLQHWSFLYLGDLSTAMGWINTISPLILLYFLYVLLGFRGTKVDAPAVFRRFVTVQFLENSRVPERTNSRSRRSEEQPDESSS